MWGALAGAVVGGVSAWLFALDLRRRDDVAAGKEATRRADVEYAIRIDNALGETIEVLSRVASINFALQKTFWDVQELGIDPKGESAIAREYARWRAARKEIRGAVFGVLAAGSFAARPEDARAFEQIWELFDRLEYKDESAQNASLSELTLRIISWRREGKPLDDLHLPDAAAD
jgi:hypothetical protein